MFGYVLGHWAIQTLGLGTPGSVTRGLILMGWLWGYTRHWLATPTIFVPLLLVHFPQVGQTVDQRFCVWAIVSILPLKDLPSRRSWPVQAMHPPLTGVFTVVIHVSFWKLPLYQVSTWSWNASLPVIFQYSSLHPPPIWSAVIFQFPPTLSPLRRSLLLYLPQEIQASDTPRALLVT